VAGYQRALQDTHLEVDQELISYGRFYQDSGYERTMRLLALSRPPTAIFAGNNFIAIGVMKALYESGLRIPEDMSVVGFDDLPPGLLVRPFLTVADQPAYEMGYRATKLLLERINNSVNPSCQEIVLPTQLVVRQSCRAI
jgi:DNA-binding LacI/PurR family transcriptional regulator